MRTGCLARAVAAAALLALAAAAQQRKPCFVTVVDAHDRPLAGAEVMLCELDGPGDATDVVRATTDERGRARPELLPSRRYLAAAAGPPRPDGARSCSEPTGRAWSGAVLTLEAWHDERPRTIPVAGAMPVDTIEWLGPFAPPHARLPVVDGSLVLPPFPPAPVRLGRRDGQGVLREVVVLASDATTSALTFGARDTGQMRVLGADHEPLPGAALAVGYSDQRVAPDVLWSCSMPRSFHAFAQADERGVVTTPTGELATGFQPLRITADGRAPHYVPMSVPRFAKAPAEVCLAHARTLRGTLRGLPPRVVARPFATVVLKPPDTSMVFVLQLPIGLDGDALQFAPPSAIVQHEIAIPLVPDDDGTPPGCVVLPAADGDLSALPDVDLAQLRHVALRAVDPQGTPVAGAEVLLVPVLQGERGGLGRPRTHLVTNALGRADLWFGAGTYLVGLGTCTAFAWQTVGATAGSGPLELAVAPLPTSTCRIVDDRGAPVRGAKFAYVGPPTIRDQPRDPVDQARAWLEGRLIGYHVQMARSDRDGRIRVPVPAWVDVPLRCRVLAGARIAEGVAVLAGEDLGDVVVR